MKQADVVVGGVYLTRIGEELARVRVTSQTTVTRYRSYDPPREVVAFNVWRVDDHGIRRGSTLPKPRTAAALRPLDW